MLDNNSVMLQPHKSLKPDRMRGNNTANGWSTEIALGFPYCITTEAMGKNRRNTLGEMNKSDDHSSSSSTPPKRTALRSGSAGSTSAMMAMRGSAVPRSLPRNRASRPERAQLFGGVGGVMLDAAVDALAVSGVMPLEAVAVGFTRGFFSAERVGGGGRRVYEREGERDGVVEGELER
jgi:hypothetical protein